MTGLEKKRFRGTPVGEAEEGVKKKVVGFPFGGVRRRVSVSFLEGLRNGLCG